MGAKSVLPPAMKKAMSRMSRPPPPNPNPTGRGQKICLLEFDGAGQGKRVALGFKNFKEPPDHILTKWFLQSLGPSGHFSGLAQPAADPQDAPYVLMATTGPAGRFNRAQRAAFNADESMPLCAGQQLGWAVG